MIKCGPLVYNPSADNTPDDKLGRISKERVEISKSLCYNRLR